MSDSREGNLLFERFDRAWDDESRRRWRLVCAACCRMVPALGELGIRLATALEGDADGIPIGALELEIPSDLDENLRELLSRAANRMNGRVLWRTGLALGHAGMDFDPFIPLLRCVFGEPSRPLAPRTWPASTLALAAACRDAWPAVDAAYAVLADALEVAGEREAADHCRTPYHVRGCHVVEALLRA